ncbi:hypothetical protein H1P_560035 [Hyella patelloides LEGE 07179]|uniref:Uncharacterized protein n=1 Tax=Hyella patelloides LEGE 07179 TaxID=945734 RepID=A0A563W0E5_9CYAN|nr:hypothetical protein H1P_560035 [Hyella patelloides LEGE 07179]
MFLNSTIFSVGATRAIFSILTSGAVLAISYEIRFKKNMNAQNIIVTQKLKAYILKAFT